MNKIFLSTFYTLLTFVAYSRAPIFLTKDSLNPEHFALANVLKLFPSGHGVFPMAFLLAMPVFLLAIFHHGAIFRIGACLTYALFSSMYWSLPSYDYSDHIWVIASLGMCFFKPSDSVHSPQNIFSIRLIQSLLMANYFIAGLWNLKTWVGVGGAKLLADSLFEQIALLVMQGTGPGYFIEKLIFSNPTLTRAALFMLVLFELLTIIPILKPKFLQTWGVCAIIFQISAMAVLGHIYLNLVLAIAFFAILTPAYLDEDSLNLFEPDPF